MDEVCSRRGREEECIKGFGEKTKKKTATTIT
jgi:hypothetical protein